MITLREAATLALEALEKATRFMSDSDYRKLNESIEVLRAALVEDAMQKFTDVNQEIEAALAEDVVTHGSAWSKDGKRIDPRSVYAEPKQDGCEHCNQPLYAAIKCRVCGRVTEPVEPVAYSVGRTLHWHQGRGVTDAQLYIAPPQRKPLTDEEIMAVYTEFMLYEEGLTPSGVQRVTRAVERAHRIV